MAVGQGMMPWAEADTAPTPGSLDLSFDGDGKVITPVGSAGQGSAMAIQPDGRIVVAGFSEQGPTGRDFVVVRYNPDGSLDATWGGDGVVATPVGPGVDRDEAYAVALQPDGRIVVAGETWTGSITHAALARYNPDGTLDDTFGGDGTVVLSIGTRSVARAVRVLADGRIVVAGGATELAGGVGLWLAVAGLNPDGTLDAGFAGGGAVITTVGNQSVAHAMVIQPDGSIVVAGRVSFFNTTLFVVARYGSDGVPDSSFGGGDGHVETSFGVGSSGSAPHDIATAVDLHPDGRIVVAGFSSLASRFQMAVVRYRTDGSLDPAWDGDGIVTTPVGTLSQAFGVTVASDGRALAAGETNTGGNVDIGLVRYSEDGSLDAGFGSGGVVTTDVGSGRNGARAVGVQDDGRILVAGDSRDGLANGINVVRYHGDAPPDTTPPETTITSAPAAVTNNATPTFEFSADEAGASFECSLNGAGFASCASPHTTGHLDDGEYVFEVRATDEAGNTDPSPALHAFEVDTTPPETAVTSGPGAVTTDTTPTFEFSSTEHGSEFACAIDGQAAAACSSPYTTDPLANGTHVFEVAASDAAGNRDLTPATMPFRVCVGPAAEQAVALDARLRPINAQLADRVLDRLCTG
ncbi:MAG: Ig-like domain-containing protein [Acidimicrobiales bacterium]